jgi:hypothetical protein
MDMVADLAPVCRITRPGANKSLGAAQRDTLMVEADDDFGLSAMVLSWRKGRDGTVDRQRYPHAPDTAKQWRLSIDWKLLPLGLYPGDTLFYWAAAFDNRPAPQSGVSDTFWFRVPGFEEIQAAIMHNTDHATEALSSVRGRQDELKKTLHDLARSQRGGAEPSWEQKQVMADVQKQVSAQRDSLASAAKELDEAISRMKDQGMQSDQLLDKMNKIRDALEQLLKAYGDSLLSKTPPPARAPDLAEMKKAIDRLKTALPGLAQQLDNTLKYLESLRKDQQREALAAQLKNLADEQDRIAAADSASAQRQRQKNLLDRAAQARADIARETAKNDEGLFKPSDLPSLDKYDSMMNAMKGSMSGGSMPPRGEQAQMSQSMRSLAQEMNSLSSSAMMARMMRERDALLGLANDVLHLAEWQREAEAGAADPDRDPREKAADQQTLADAVRENGRKLDSLSTVPPGLMQKLAMNYETAAGAMQRLLGAMADAPSGAPASAVGSLNSLAASLLQASDAMAGQSQMPGGGGGGLMDLLRQLSGKQGAINAATADLLRRLLSKQPGGAEGGSGQSDARAKQEAQAAQQALADQLKQLADKYGKEAGGSMDNRLRNLEEEARQLAKMLENPQQELRDKQDRFLSRLLQTTLSLNREGEGKEERKSTSAQTVFSAGPANGDIISNTDTFYRLRTRALQGNVPAEYRGAVRAYFDSLGTKLLRE